MKEMDLQQLLNELSSESAAPGGGSVAGLAGALSAAMVSMVCKLTIGKKKYQDSEDDMKKCLENVTKMKEEFLLLADRDAEVFNDVMEAYRLPHGTEEEKAERSNAVEEATKRAALVPMDVLRRCETLAGLTRSVALKGNENSISDAGVAAVMAQAAAKAACLNILINLSTISDEDFKGKLKTEQENVFKTVRDITEEALQIVKQKI
ncbi:MAG: cyclodeaminase/cyclohydrolase family protein [Calditrichaeota bacterium]|nr:cyclodeaminase/cyclohydrolase family protein [Calditrichota bacterium]